MMPQVISRLLEEAYTRKASDLHLIPGDFPRARIKGKIEIFDQNVVTNEAFEHFWRQFFPIDWQKSKAKEIDFSLDWRRPVPFRIRAHLFQVTGEWRLSFRLFRSKIPTPEELGIAPILLQHIQKQSGLILLTGPTGSGKTTTLASLIQRINQIASVRIITLEDPIEYCYPAGQAMIEQREVGRDTKSFTQGIYTSLRQDPDVMVIGELRELDAMEASLQAAEAGKLVLATMHASSAIQAIYRYIGGFPESRQNWIRSQLADVVLSVVNQRLMHVEGKDNPFIIQEVLVANQAVRNLIRTNQLAQLASVMETGQKDGMQTMERAKHSVSIERWKGEKTWR